MRRAALGALLTLVLVGTVAHAPAEAQSSKTTTTTTSPEETVTTPVAPGETAPNGGPLLVPGDPQVSSDSGGDAVNNDNTGTVVARVISGLLVVALLLALLTYWFWRNTRPVPVGASPRAVSEERPTARSQVIERG